MHCLGVTAMYLASKYEDIFPLHSKIVSEKIAHNAIAAKDILKKEVEFLQLFEYEMDFVTHWDFHQTYVDKLEKLMGKGHCADPNSLLTKVSEMAMFLIKMSIQNVDFCKHSPSIVVLSSLYASTSFLKHSKNLQSKETTKFCDEVRKIIVQMLNEERKE